MLTRDAWKKTTIREADVKSLWTSINGVSDFGLNGDCREGFKGYHQHTVLFDRILFYEK